ncbi:hypothetical protein TWF718_001940 [Orbilia javanica]|uniref:Uncharacterized protein n=1 Tax=Orbilia javanica TaxID=47235 RepID=A0AAN8N9B8_9PEZI
MEIPRALRDLRLDLIRLCLPTSNSDGMTEMNSEVLQVKAKYFTEARYYPDYATATGHPDFLKKRSPSASLLVCLHLGNFSTAAWELVTAECSGGCQFAYPPPEKILSETEKCIVLEALADSGSSSNLGDAYEIDAKVAYNLKNGDTTTRVAISIKKGQISAETKVSCTGLDPEKYAVDGLFDGAIFVVLD